MHYIKLLILIPVLVLVLPACQTKATQEQITASANTITACHDKAIAYQNAMLANTPKFKDDRDALIYLMFVKSQKDEIFESCDDLTIALLSYHQARFNKIVDGSFRLGGLAIGLVGLDMIVDGFNAGSTTGDTWNVSGSRVVNKSSGSSASGEGLGIGNVFGGRTAQGGLEPRQFQIPDNQTLDLNNGSQSGDNAPAAPVDGSGTASTLPAE